MENEIKFIRNLDILTKSNIKLWGTMKERLKWFFKYKCKLFNQIRSENYRELMLKYLYLKIKSNKTKEDDDALSKKETELEQNFAYKLVLITMLICMLLVTC